MRANVGIPAGKNTPRSAGQLRMSQRGGIAMGLAVGGGGGSRAFLFSVLKTAEQWEGRETDERDASSSVDNRSISRIAWCT